MARVEQVPEHADGGFWYVVGVREPEDMPGREPDLPDGASGWCAWYGDNWCVVRTPDPIEGVDWAAVDAAEVIAVAYDSGSLPDTVKPYARIGGR